MPADASPDDTPTEAPDATIRRNQGFPERQRRSSTRADSTQASGATPTRPRLYRTCSRSGRCSTTPEAYRNACAAIESLGPNDGVLTLPELSAFEYLRCKADSTATRPAWPTIRRLVDEGIACGRDADGTLLADASVNLSAKVAAQRLFVHANTAHQRLARIEEKTGCDLRNLADVQKLLVAIRLGHRCEYGQRPSDDAITRAPPTGPASASHSGPPGRATSATTGNVSHHTR